MPVVHSNSLEVTKKPHLNLIKQFIYFTWELCECSSFAKGIFCTTRVVAKVRRVNFSDVQGLSAAFCLEQKSIRFV